MANAKSSIILDEGLNAVHGGAVGSYFALKYWLPIYDPRIDNEIHTSTQIATQSAGTDVYPLSATLISTHEYADLEGEKLFNADSAEFRNHVGVSDAEDVYTLPSTLNYVVSGSKNISNLGTGYAINVSATATTITSSSQSKGVKVNLINNNYAISQVLSGTDLVADGVGGFTGSDIAQIPQITEIQYALGGGVNTSAVGLLYPVSSFSSMIISGDNVDAGRYDIRLEAHGPFRFNKFVLFVSKMNANGTEDNTYLPVPFSVSVFEGTTEKVRTTNDGTGLQWEGIIQLGFQRDPSLTNLTSQVIETWTDLGLSAFQLATNKKVHIFDSDYDVSPVSAKLTVTDDSIDQLRLAYNTSAYSTLTTCADGCLTISANSLNIRGDVTFNDTVSLSSVDTQDTDLVVYTGTNKALILSGDPGASEYIYLTTRINQDSSIIISGTGGPTAGGCDLYLACNKNLYLQADSNIHLGVYGESNYIYSWINHRFLTSAVFDDTVTMDGVLSCNTSAIFNDNVTFNDTVTISTTPTSATNFAHSKLVINDKSDFATGISIVGPNNGYSLLIFGRENHTSAGYLTYYHGNDIPANAWFQIMVEDTLIHTMTSVYSRCHTSAIFDDTLSCVSSAHFSNNVFITDTATSAGERGDYMYDQLVITNGTSYSYGAGIQLISKNDSNLGGITFGREANSNSGGILFNHNINDNEFTIWVDSVTCEIFTSSCNKVQIPLALKEQTSIPSQEALYGKLFTSADPGAPLNAIGLYFINNSGTVWRVQSAAPY